MTIAVTALNRARGIVWLAVGAVFLLGCGPAAKSVHPRPSPIEQDAGAGGAPTDVRFALVYELPIPGDTAEAVAYSPDGTRIAGGMAGGHVAVWDSALISDAPLVDVKAHDSFVSTLAWSPDGQMIATGSTDGSVRVYDAQFQQLRQRFATVSQRFVAVSWSPDSRMLAVARGEHAVDVYDVQAPQTPWYSIPVAGQTTDVAWSPDGALLAAGGRNGSVAIASTSTHQITRTVAHPELRDVGTLAWSPDGQQLAAGYIGGTILLINPRTGETVQTLAPVRQVNALAWSPNGQLLASTSLDFQVILWSGATGQRLSSIPVGYDVNGANWSPDGRYLAFGTDGHVLALYAVSPPQGEIGAGNRYPGWSRSHMPQ